MGVFAINQSISTCNNTRLDLVQTLVIGYHKKQGWEYKSNCNSNTWGVLQSYYSQERNDSSYHSDGVKLLAVAINNHNLHKLKEKEELPL